MVIEQVAMVFVIFFSKQFFCKTNKTSVELFLACLTVFGMKKATLATNDSSFHSTRNHTVYINIYITI